MSVVLSEHSAPFHQIRSTRHQIRSTRRAKRRFATDDETVKGHQLTGCGSQLVVEHVKQFAA